VSGSAPGRASVLRQVVLVDREIDAFRDVAIALRDEYDFHITISGAEALNLLRDGAIDTIVVGQTLYSSTGLNVLAEARRHAPHTHRVLLANTVEAGSLERGASAAPFELMQRPCTADKLRGLLENHAAPPEDAISLPQRVVAATYARPADTHNPADFEHVVMETAPARSRVTLKPSRTEADSLPLIVYTDNGEFYQAITLALQDRHEVRLCTQLDRAAELAEMGMCPLLITDRANTEVELQRIAIPLRALDAGMVTIAAGTPEVGASLRKLLGTDALHGFLPKPISAPLVRLAVESAKRHYLQSRALKHEQPQLKATVPQSKAKPTAQTLQSSQHMPGYLPSYRNDFNIDSYKESSWRQAAPRLALAAVAVLVLAIGGWFGWRQYMQYADSAKPLAKEMELAQRAFDAGQYATTDGAVYHYGEALKLAPQNAAATAGLDQTVERIIDQAERALMDEQLPTAEAAIEVVRAVRPEHKRLRFLESQLDKARAQLAAKSAVRPANHGTTVATPAIDMPISNETQRQQLIARWLATARQRLAQNRLLTPENDSAEYYLRQVERADPGNQVMQQGLLDIGARLLTDARDALSRQQLQLAKRRVDEALRFGADAAVVDRLRMDINSAAGATARSSLLQLVLQRSRDNQLFDPDRDSAKYYLLQLQQLDPTAVETEQATRTVGLKLIENADQALAQQQMSTAVQLLNEARRLGFNGNELTAAEARARIARTPAPASPRNTVAAAPKAIKTVPPKFPDDAMRAGVAGWVDVSFHISARGDVTDAVPVASNPPGQFAPQFERAAVAAIRQYKFEARELSDTQTQTMVVRVQFKLQ
jgi:TonB family protein